MDKRFLLVAMMTFLTGIPAAQSQVIVAHRGASHDAPENTLAAFRLAWEQESDGIEGDFYLTADRKIVCIHDKDTQRTTAKNMVVKDATLQQLRSLDAGQWKANEWIGEPIPTCEEVLATVPSHGLFVIELKTGPEIVPVLREELSRQDVSKIQLLIISFHAETIVACKQQLPEVRAHWLTSFKRQTPLSPWQPTAALVAAEVRQCGANGVGMKGDREIIDTEFIKQLKQHGCDEFHVWTIDEPEDAIYFRSLGAIGITTNRPREIGKALRNALPGS